jgi:hypothetical protein
LIITAKGTRTGLAAGCKPSGCAPILCDKFSIRDEAPSAASGSFPTPPATTPPIDAALILPAVSTLAGPRTVPVIKAFAVASGRVIASGSLPRQTSDTGSDEAVTAALAGLPLRHVGEPDRETVASLSAMLFPSRRRASSMGRPSRRRRASMAVCGSPFSTTSRNGASSGYPCRTARSISWACIRKPARCRLSPMG